MSFLSTLFGKKIKKEDIPISRLPEQPKTELHTPKETLPPSSTPPTLAKEPVQKETTVWKPGDVILEHYDVERVITSGGMGTVYITNHRNWKVKVAIKSPNEEMLSHPSLFQRVITEAEAWTELGLHPNIAYCYFVRNIGEIPHIFVEYVDGGNLRDWIEEGRCADLKTGLDFAIQFCHGMAHAHSKGMIHRDIKPGNILMTKDGTLKVTDFGIARVGNDKEGDLSLRTKDTTKTVGFMGTEPYASHEQLKDAHSVGPESDVYSFGVCLWEMFLGRRPRSNAWNDDPLLDPKALNSSLPDSCALLLTEMVTLDRDTRIALGGLDSLKERFKAIYQDLFHEPSPHSELEQVDIEADGLNNKGVSLFELGKEQSAMECWQQAADKDPIHFESNLNLSYFQWRHVQIADDVLMRRIRDLMSNYDKSQYLCPTMRIYLESGMAPWNALKTIDDHLDEIKSDDPISRVFMADLLKLKTDISRNGKPQKELPTMACFATLDKHSGSVFCADFSPNDNYFLSGSADHTIRMWDIESLKCLKVFEGHSDEVRAVAFLPGGRQFVSASFDMTIKIWDTDKPACVKTLKGHDFDITCLAVTKNAQRILSGSYNGIIKLWDISTGNCLITYQGHERGVTSVSLAPDNLTFVSTAFDNTMRVWNVETGDCNHLFKETGYSVNSAKYSLDGRCLVAGCSDQLIRLIDIASGACLKKFSGHTGEVSSVDISPNGKYILSGGRGGAHAGSSDRSVRLWEMESGRCQCTMTTFSPHKLNVNFVCFSSTGIYSISTSNDKTLKLWATFYPEPFVSLYTPLLSKPVDFQELSEKKNTAQRVCQKAQNEMAKGAYKSAYDILNTNLVSSGMEHDNIRGLITICGNRSGKRISLKNVWNCATYHHDGKVFSAIFSPDCKHAYSGSFDGQIKVLNLSDRCHHVLVSNTGPVNSLDISPDGKTLVSGHWSDRNQLQLWDAMTGDRFAGIDYHKAVALSVTFSRNGKLIASGCDDGSIHVIDSELRTEVFAAQGHTERITRVAFTDNDRRLLSRSQDKTIKCWDLKDKKCVATLQTPGKLLCLHPDKKHLIIGLTDLSMIDINTGETTWKADDKRYSEFDSITISEDGRFILAGHRHPNIHVWDVSKNKVIKIMEGHQDSVPGLQFSKDNRYAISGSWDHSVRLWEFEWDWEFDH
jgi:WD40 repeat protein